ncbi:cytochrome P450 [Cubamyces menziesii]|nr:cytochrome P450 [Cubamyces menziesii]
MIHYVLLAALTWLAWKLVRALMPSRSQIDKLPGPPSTSWLTGHLPQIYDNQGWAFHGEIAKYGPVFKLQNTLGRPMLCVYDPVAMHSIAVKDAHIFEEMQWFLDLTYDTFGPGLLSTVGDTHRKQRKLINPVFSSKNLQRLTPVFYEVVGRLTQGIGALVKTGTAEVDMADFFGRTALELVGQAAVGHSFDPLTEIKHNPYSDALKAYLPTLYTLSSYFQLYAFLRPLIPPPLRRPLANLLPSRRMKAVLHILDTMHESAVEIYNEKKREAAANGLRNDDASDRAKDLMTVLLQANAGASEEDTLPEEELISQLSTFLFAATDTTSSALALTLHRLAGRTDVQEKLREEVQAAKRRHGGGAIPYDELVALPYLDAVCRETLRVHVVAPLRFREARADAVLPLSKPVRGTDGELLHSIFVPKGTRIFVLIQASNVSPELWGADAHEWRPERWLEPLPDALAGAKIPGVYSNLMTFWGGGRACIGFKFSQLEMKVVLAELLAAFSFEEAGKPIAWNIGEAIYPTIGQCSTRPEFPMKVTALKPASFTETTG